MNSKIICGNALDVLMGMKNETANCFVTSPPYFGLRDYNVEGQLGQEESPEDYIENLVTICRQIKRALRKDGTFWLNLGDSYWATRSQNGEMNGIGGNSFSARINHARAGGKSHPVYKPKDLMMIPARVALALQADGFYLRSQIIWHKPNAMPESVKDRPTNDYELLYLLTKSEDYFYDYEILKEPAKDWGSRNRANGKYTSGNPPISGGKHGGLEKGDFAEDGRNKRAVWSINTKPYTGAHFATMPVRLAEDCIKAGCPEGGLVIDPFGGAGTTAVAAIQTNRDYLLIELNPDYIPLAEKRVQNVNRPLFVS